MTAGADLNTQAEFSLAREVLTVEVYLAKERLNYWNERLNHDRFNPWLLLCFDLEWRLYRDLLHDWQHINSAHVALRYRSVREVQVAEYTVGGDIEDYLASRADRVRLTILHSA